MADNDIQGRIGTLLDGVDDDFLRAAIAEAFTMERVKTGHGEVTCSACGVTRRYDLKIHVPDYRGIAYAVKTLLDATGRTREPPKPQNPEVTQRQVDEMVEASLKRILSAEISDDDLSRLASG